MARPYNFSAGPAAMPAEVLQQASEEMLDWRGSGMSVMEMSHRGQEFGTILKAAEADLRELLAIRAHDLGGLLQLGLAYVADAGRERDQDQEPGQDRHQARGHAPERDQGQLVIAGQFSIGACFGGAAVNWLHHA